MVLSSPPIKMHTFFKTIKRCFIEVKTRVDDGSCFKSEIKKFSRWFSTGIQVSIHHLQGQKQVMF